MCASVFTESLRGFYFVSVTDSLIDHADTVRPKGPPNHSMGLSGVPISHPESDCQPRPNLLLGKVVFFDCTAASFLPSWSFST